MSQPTSRSISHYLRIAKIPFLLLVLSFGAALFLVNSGSFWHFVSWLPRTVTQVLIGFLNTILSPILPAEVHAQEELLEFFTAWCFSGAALFALYLSFVAMRGVFRARMPNAS